MSSGSKKLEPDECRCVAGPLTWRGQRVSICRLPQGVRFVGKCSPGDQGEPEEQIGEEVKEAEGE